MCVSKNNKRALVERARTGDAPGDASCKAAPLNIPNCFSINIHKNTFYPLTMLYLFVFENNVLSCVSTIDSFLRVVLTCISLFN